MVTLFIYSHFFGEFSHQILLAANNPQNRNIEKAFNTNGRIMFQLELFLAQCTAVSRPKLW